jgi:BirA family transcriptional regulator, biotin operon repressor / biotin---[acetyl-CoA-carboxylase] ligase
VTTRVEQRLAAVDFVTRVLARPVTTSTNDDVRKLAAQGAPEGTVVVADRQTEGRGRLGRAWHSPEGAGLYLSVLLRPTEPAEQLGRYAIAAAVAVCEACRALAGARVGIKWPNDVLGDGRKLAGILCELRGGGAGGAELVVGVGVNVNALEADFPEALRSGATSLRLLRGGEPFRRDDVATEVVRRLAGGVGALRAGRWEEVASRFLSYSPSAAGRTVRLAAGGVGITRGLDATGALRVATDHGIVLVHSGESVVPVEG